MSKTIKHYALDAITRRAILKATEQLTRGNKQKSPEEMWRGFKSYDHIRHGEYNPPPSLQPLAPESVARRRHDVTFNELDGLIAHPAVFHTPLQEKADYAFCQLHPNLTVLRIDGRVRGGRPPDPGVFGTGIAIGAPARFPDYLHVAFSAHRGLPIITTRWNQNGAEFASECFVVGADEEPPGTFCYNRVLWERLTIRNPGRRILRQQIFKCFAIAPRSAFGWCNYGRFNGYPTDAWSSGSLHLELRDNELNHNGRMICRIDRPPDVALRLSAFPGDAHPDSFKSKEKAPCFSLELAPGASIQITFRTCFADRFWDVAGRQAVRRLRYERERAKCIRRWEQVLKRGAQLNIPEKRVMDAWRAQVVSLHQMHHRFVETDDVLFPSQGSVWPMAAWVGEARHCADTFDQLGLHAEAAKIIEYFTRKQIDWSGPEKADISTLSGAFDSNCNWMQDTGCMLGVMGRHYLMSGDREWLKAKTASALMAIEWIHLQRQLTKVKDAHGRPARHYGLLPSGRATDAEEKGYFYAFTDCPSWYGLHQIVKAFQKAGIQLPDHLQGELNDYRRCLQRVFRTALRLCPAWDRDLVPHVVYPPKGQLPWAWAGSMLIAINAGMTPVGSALFRELYRRIDRRLCTDGRQLLGLCNRLDDEHLTDSTPRCGIKGAEWYVIVVEYERYRIYMERNEPEKALLTLYSLIAYCLTDTLQTTERISAVDPYWAPVQVNPSGSARLITMIAEAIIFEREHGLFFLRGVPRVWLEPLRSFSLRDWKTEHGAVSCAVRVDRTGDCVTGEIAIVNGRGPVAGDILLRHPRGKPIKKVRINGHAYHHFKSDRVFFKRLPAKVKFEVGF